MRKSQREEAQRSGMNCQQGFGEDSKWCSLVCEEDFGLDPDGKGDPLEM